MSKVIITYQQCKAARDLISWKQEDLSKKAGINKATLANLKIDTLEKIIDAFEKEGVRFENNDVKFSVELMK
jgi:DNA-binding XRE family transcriptional regulator